MSKKPASKTAAPKKPRGRPSLYTPERASRICDRLSQGEPLTVICAAPGMPSDGTVREWMNKRQEFADAIARARELGFDAIAWEAKRIADTPLIGEEQTEKDDGRIETKRGDMLGHRKLQIETRLKLLAKWDPKRYGDRTTLAGDPEAPLLGSDEQLIARAAAILASVKGEGSVG